MKRLPRKYEEDMKEFFRSEAKTFLECWGWFFAEKNGHQTLVAEALICMVQDNYLGVKYIRYIIYIRICMYYIVNHCWFPGFKLPTSNASRNELNAVEALGAADGPLRVAHHTGGKLMSTSQGSGWEPLFRDVGSTSRGWRGDVDIGLMMLMIRSVFFMFKKNTDARISWSWQCIWVVIFLNGASQGRQEEPWKPSQFFTWLDVKREWCDEDPKPLAAFFFNQKWSYLVECWVSFELQNPVWLI